MEKQTFADRLNMALKMRNISAAELSKRSGASEGLISGYRKGAYKAKQDRLDRFAQILDVSIPWLLSRVSGVRIPAGSPNEKIPQTVDTQWLAGFLLSVYLSILWPVRLQESAYFNVFQHKQGCQKGVKFGRIIAAVIPRAGSHRNALLGPGLRPACRC